jgi:radical SAM enzyme (TIGR01210 family)
MCRFCGLPLAVRLYLDEYWEGRRLTPAEHLGIFQANLEHLAPANGGIHTVMCFNAGSFLAQLANPLPLQKEVARLIAAHPTVQRFVIEARAELITPEALRVLTDILHPAGKKLTVRVGVETQDDALRTKVGKGHPRPKLFAAAQAMREAGVTSGGYILLNPAPGLDPAWAMAEAAKSLGFVLGAAADQLGMDEAYFGATCVAPSVAGQETSLHTEWLAGRFRPAGLWAVWKVSREAVKRYGRRVHLLPMKDEPPLVAVPSNHVPEGIPESLEGAKGCDRAFHAMLECYRATMDPEVLEHPPQCACRPGWAV